MIRLEEESLEQFSLSGGAGIAVPIEIFRGADGGLTITSYRICLDTAEAFERLYANDPFSDAADRFLRERLTKQLASFGFRPDRAASDVILEWERREPYGDLSTEPAVLLTETPEGGFSSRLTFCPEPEPGVWETAAAVVFVGGKIVSAAQCNDLCGEDGSFEINVETAPRWRRRGFGASCVRVLTDALLRAGESVVYDCRSQNIGSAKTALAAGFTRRGERRSFVCYSD